MKFLKSFPELYSLIIMIVMLDLNQLWLFIMASMLNLFVGESMLNLFVGEPTLSLFIVDAKLVRYLACLIIKIF